LVFEPQEFLARLAALIPPPRAHELRFHGILAPSAGWRDHVVPAQAHSADGSGDTDACPQRSRRAPASTRIAWSELIRRVFAADALLCPRCGSRTRIMAAIRCPDAVGCVPCLCRSAGASAAGSSSAQVKLPGGARSELGRGLRLIRLL
jgi:hypothetical protein